MQKYFNNVQNLTGDAISGVTVTVRRVSDGGLASIFSDNLKPTPTVKANPFTNDSDGEFFFFAGNNLYNIFLTGSVTDTIGDITLFDKTDTPLRGPIVEIAVAGPTAMALGHVVLVDVTSAAVVLELPSDPGSNVQFPDIIVQHIAGAITSNNITIQRNGELIGGVAADIVMSVTNQAVRLTWGGSTLGWAIQTVSGSGVADGTVTNAAIKWNGSAWVQDANFLLNSTGLNVDGTVISVDSSAASITRIQAINSGGGIGMEVAASGAGLLRQFSSGGAGEDILIGFTRNAGMTFRYNNLIAMRVIGEGLIQIDASAVSNEGGQINFEGEGSNTDVAIENISGHLRGLVNGGGEVTFRGLVNGGFEAYHNNIVQLITIDNDANHNSSGAIIRLHDNGFYDIGPIGLRGIDVTGNIALSELHSGAALHKDAGGTLTITAPSGTSGAIMPVGEGCIIKNFDTEVLTVDAAGTMYLFDGQGLPSAQASGQVAIAAGGVGTFLHYSNSVWHAWGTGLS